MAAKQTRLALVGNDLYNLNALSPGGGRDWTSPSAGGSRLLPILWAG